MIRIMVFLIGASVLGAIFAAAYYAPDNEYREDSSAYNLAPGEVRQDTVHPTLPGSPIVYEVEVRAGEIDVYVMERSWASSLSRDGRIALDQPFSYDAALSKTHVNGTFSFVLQSDGETSYTVVFDNGDNFYAGDAGENMTGTARVATSVRFVEEEARSLTFGYLAAIPSVLLVIVTIGRQVKRRRRNRRKAAG